MIKAEIAGERATLIGPFPFAFIRTINTLSGHKVWKTSSTVNVMATPGNIRLLKASDHAIEFIDKTGDLKAQEELEQLASQHAPTPEWAFDYKPQIELFDHQKKALAISAERPAYAYLWEMGLGKTAGLIANSGILYSKALLTGVLVVTPKGVHRQWLDSEIPKHIDKTVRWHGILWKGKPIDDELRRGKGSLQFFAINIDALRTPKGKAECIKFLKAHQGKSKMIVDESHNIKTPGAQRTKAAIELGKLATYRRIATGTPISKTVIDAWSQFQFLNPNILGYKYWTAFRSRYCIMGGWENKQIIGQKNIEEFYSLIAPHSFRMTKEEALDLPEKVYITQEYDMSDETALHYKSIRDSLMTSLEDGTLIDIKNGAVAIGRLQQTICGHLPNATGVERFGGERLELMLEIVRQRTGPIVIWHRFIEDGRAILEALESEGEQAVRYLGKDDERSAAVKAFLNGDARVFVSNPKTGGVGLNLQGYCQTVIYYSNSFDALDRWQSEDRVHRTGMKGAVTYFDLVARKSVDRLILRNLRTKKSISDLTFDEIRRAIVQEV